ncbi:acyltransferase [Methanosarcina sp. KYL-1]|uniref:acyltransferase n=1 Tax=Methanosarcina sp. KYL-1 TaxID=2602068 RepID=UPI002100E34E|nr:acyltransferase [Methanosarcina sp. KYL-1]MCQ1536896.1 acyltransferase [Methanosarcina sp. KYL-1]
MQTQRIIELDYLRAFAILAVISIHTLDYFRYIPEVNALVISSLILYVFVRFAVPMFVFVSGFVLALKYGDRFSRKTYFVKRARAVIPPYMVFSAIYLILPDYLFNGQLKFPSVGEFLVNLFSGNSYGHLWFIPLILQFYVLYPATIGIYQRFAEKRNPLLLLALSAFFQDIWIVMASLFNQYSYATINVIMDRAFVSHVFYFLFGIYICKNYADVRKKILGLRGRHLLTLAPVTLFMSSFWIYGLLRYGDYFKIPSYYVGIPHMLFPIYFTLIFVVLFRLGLILSKNNNLCSNFIFQLGRESFGIYLIHALFLHLTVKMIYPGLNIEYTQWKFYPLLFLFTVLLSYTSVNLFNHLPFSELFFGHK